MGRSFGRKRSKMAPGGRSRRWEPGGRHGRLMDMRLAVSVVMVAALTGRSHRHVGLRRRRGDGRRRGRVRSLRHRSRRPRVDDKGDRPCPRRRAALVESAALDRICSYHLAHADLAKALDVVRRRGDVLGTVQLDALSGFQFNDCLLMASEIHVAAGNLALAAEYADTLAQLAC